MPGRAPASWGFITWRTELAATLLAGLVGVMVAVSLMGRTAWKVLAAALLALAAFWGGILLFHRFQVLANPIIPIFSMLLATILASEAPALSDIMRTRITRIKGRS
jgi:carbon starvation protein CstA